MCRTFGEEVGLSRTTSIQSEKSIKSPPHSSSAAAISPNFLATSALPSPAELQRFHQTARFARLAPAPAPSTHTQHGIGLHHAPSHSPLAACSTHFQMPRPALLSHTQSSQACPILRTSSHELLTMPLVISPSHCLC